MTSQMQRFIYASAVIAVGLAFIAWKYPQTVRGIVAFKVITPF